MPALRNRARKYNTQNMLPMFRKAAALRDDMIDAGFTDNGGAIHSAERILTIFGLRLNYPDLGHLNNLRHHEGAEFSVAALAAHGRGERVLIEHVSPIRDFTREAIRLVREKASDDDLTNFVRKNFQLVLLTPDETLHLNKHNRSKMVQDRLIRAGITLASKRT